MAEEKTTRPPRLEEKFGEKVLEDILEKLDISEETGLPAGKELPPGMEEEIKERIRQRLEVELRSRLSRIKEEILEEVAARIAAPPLKKAPEHEKEFLRFNMLVRLQHIIMFVSVVILILTGLPLKFHHFGISVPLLGLFGGVGGSRFMHRAGAAGLIFVGAFHLLYIIAWREGRRDFWLLIPRPRDLFDVIRQIKYYLGLTKERALFGRFSYVEKFDYWAVYWGMVIMIGSGAILWWFDVAMQFLPKFFVDIAKEAHSDEGLLATLAITIWHFYNVHLNPSTFPMSWTWWTGKLSKKDMLHHHPLEYEAIAARQQTTQAATATFANTEEK
jgi:cytochrome b subunit of formate dehydrogenase